MKSVSLKHGKVNLDLQDHHTSDTQQNTTLGSMYLREQTESQPQHTVQSSSQINFQAYQQQYLQQLQQRSKATDAHSLMAPPSMSQVNPPPDNLFTFQELGDN